MPYRHPWRSISRKNTLEKAAYFNLDIIKSAYNLYCVQVELRLKVYGGVY